MTATRRNKNLGRLNEKFKLPKRKKPTLVPTTGIQVVNSTGKKEMYKCSCESKLFHKEELTCMSCNTAYAS